MHIAADARIINMSLTGMSVSSHSPMRIGRSYALTLRHGNGLELKLQGTVMWCHLRAVGGERRDEAGPLYEAGIRFDDVLSDNATGLVRFLEESAMIAPNQRLAGRFTVTAGQGVSLDTSYEFEVRTISVSGMLIEADAAPPPDTVIELSVKLDGHTLKSPARVAFQRDVGSADKRRITQIGVEFLELSPADHKALEKVISAAIE